jgi:hypothetical protein
MFVCFAFGIARFAGCLIAFRNKPEEAAKYQVIVRGETLTETQKIWRQILRLGMNCGLIGLS